MCSGKIRYQVNGEEDQEKESLRELGRSLNTMIEVQRRQNKLIEVERH